MLRYGGLGAIHTLVTKLKLPQTINEHVQVLWRHLPYFESDHVLSLCYSALTGAKTLEDINRLRRDEVYLDALAVERVPAPSTAGDFLRRFDQAAILHLQTDATLMSESGRCSAHFGNPALMSGVLHSLSLRQSVRGTRR